MPNEIQTEVGQPVMIDNGNGISQGQVSFPEGTFYISQAESQETFTTPNGTKPIWSCSITSNAQATSDSCVTTTKSNEEKLWQ